MPTYSTRGGGGAESYLHIVAVEARKRTTFCHSLLWPYVPSQSRRQLSQTLIYLCQSVNFGCQSPSLLVLVGGSGFCSFDTARIHLCDRCQAKPNGYPGSCRNREWLVHLAELSLLLLSTCKLCQNLIFSYEGYSPIAGGRLDSVARSFVRIMIRFSGLPKLVPSGDTPGRYVLWAVRVSVVKAVRHGTVCASCSKSGEIRTDSTATSPTSEALSPFGDAASI